MPDSLRGELHTPTRKLCVLLHGLCCHEGVWNYPADPARSYGSALRDDLGYTPLFLRYNTGLPIPYNGKSLEHAARGAAARLSRAGSTRSS